MVEKMEPTPAENTLTTPNVIESCLENLSARFSIVFSARCGIAKELPDNVIKKMIIDENKEFAECFCNEIDVELGEILTKAATSYAPDKEKIWHEFHTSMRKIWEIFITSMEVKVHI